MRALFLITLLLVTALAVNEKSSADIMGEETISTVRRGEQKRYEDNCETEQSCMVICMKTYLGLNKDEMMCSAAKSQDTTDPDNGLENSEKDMFHILFEEEVFVPHNRMPSVASGLIWFICLFFVSLILLKFIGYCIIMYRLVDNIVVRYRLEERYLDGTWRPD